MRQRRCVDVSNAARDARDARDVRDVRLINVNDNHDMYSQRCERSDVTITSHPPSAMNHKAMPASGSDGPHAYSTISKPSTNSVGYTYSALSQTVSSPMHTKETPPRDASLKTPNTAVSGENAVKTSKENNAIPRAHNSSPSPEPIKNPQPRVTSNNAITIV
ncbi:hypothetical protein DPMN_141927 [Dreissena polymorpha]|uniref:Uncharacterized protein n=1 Tax=Dreissena polymorpha TaxID=45954 RepID=A0A9D4JLR0_DREPO|nr:hypothetical protein DPMN_141927 [Dreissena polymorpha]